MPEVPTPSLLRSEPVLPVGDMRVTREWYEHALDFKTTILNKTDRYPDGNYAELRRDGVSLSLLLCGPPYHSPWHTPGTQSTVIHVEGVDQLHAQVLAKGVKVTRELRTEGWGSRTFALNDPDGNHVFLVQSMRDR